MAETGRMAGAVTEDVRIESIGAGGVGVGRLADGRVVFVPATAPGDLATVRLERTARRWARGQVTAVREQGPTRRVPPCPFAGRCGGCALEHLEYGAQLAAKAGIVAEALARIGGRRVDPPEVVAAPEVIRYRNRVSLTLRRLASGRVVAGFHALGDPARVVDVDGRCLLPEARLARAMDDLRGAWGPRAERLPSGRELRVTLRATAEGQIVLRVDGGYGPGRPGELLEAVPGLVSIWHAASGAPPTLLAGRPRVAERWAGEEVELGASAFLQVNRTAAPGLEEEVLARVGKVAGLRVVDGYCGIATIGRRLAAAGADVVGIEADPDAAREADRLAPEGFRVVTRGVEEALPGLLPADLLLLNPPRGGVDASVADAIRAAPPGRVVYVSCDPATLARDLARFGEGLEVRGLRAFDLFPQTAHVETVVELCATS